MKEVIVRLTSDHIKVKGAEYVQDFVRCQDCKHWDNTDNAERCSHEYGGMWAKPDDFCSYGERREP